MYKVKQKQITGGIKMNNALKLKADIAKSIANWDEYSQFTLKGVRNLSMSDMNILEMYADNYIQNGCTSFSGMMDPLGEIKEVLDAYGVKSLYNSIW